MTEARPTGDSAAATGDRLTPEQVHDVAFSKPRLRRRGYNEDEVNEFFDPVEAALRDPAGRILTPEQVRNIVFSKPPIGKRGYSEDQVDAFVALVEEQLTSDSKSR
jgi:DivIVA domain-containing protein